MNGLLITAADNTKTFIPSSQILEVKASATGVLTDLIYQKNDNSAAATTVSSIPIWIPGTNTRYEVGCLGPSGHMMAYFRNYN